MKEIYQGFGRFYSSKYTVEGCQPDWERGGIYFEKALSNREPHPSLLKDYGVHLIQIEVKRASAQQDFDCLYPTDRLELETLRSRAESSFHASLKARKDEPGVPG